MKRDSEEAFLYATFREFNKCWRSGKKARVIMESFNGQAFVNFSAFVGNPDDTHFHPRPSKQILPKKPRKKSEKKIKRDNDRAARFQENQRRNKEREVLNSEPVDNPRPPSANSGIQFSFASPAKEDLSNLSTSTTNQDKTDLSTITTNQDKTDSMMDVQNIDTQESEHKDSSHELEESDFPGDDLEYLSSLPLFHEYSRSLWCREGIPETLGMKILLENHLLIEDDDYLTKDEVVTIRKLAKKYKAQPLAAPFKKQ